MKDYIEERAVEIAYYIIEHKATLRQTAKEFGVSKSTIHKDCTDRLEQINPTLAQSVRKVLDVNKQERHIRGGLAIVSPSARPNAIIALATIPGRIAGSITLINTYSLDKPSANPDFSYVRFAFTSDS